MSLMPVLLPGLCAMVIVLVAIATWLSVVALRREGAGMPIEIDMMDTASRITVNVRVKRFRQFRARLWIALLLARLAIWIAGMAFVAEECECDCEG